MGLFNMIGQAVQEGKERAEMQAKPITDRIQRTDLRDGAIVLCKEFNRLSSIAAKTKVTRVYRQKIYQITDSDEIYAAFEEMYRYYSQRSNIIAFNISQWLGKRLYEMDDYRVREEESSSDKTIYIPS